MTPDIEGARWEAFLNGSSIGGGEGKIVLETSASRDMPSFPKHYGPRRKPVLSPRQYVSHILREGHARGFTVQDLVVELRKTLPAELIQGVIDDLVAAGVLPKPEPPSEARGVFQFLASTQVRTFRPSPQQQRAMRQLDATIMRFDT